MLLRKIRESKRRWMRQNSYNYGGDSYEMQLDLALVFEKVLSGFI
jgi:hypothetical protein